MGMSAPAAGATTFPAWSVQPTPNPAGATGSALSAVSCPTRTTCTAVGYFDSSSDAGRPLAERWDVSRWSTEPVPEPARSSTGLLFGVSCPSLSRCFAVGSVTQRGGVTGPLAERWNGAAWALQRTPQLPPNPGDVTYLGGVSCPSPRYCIAVGYTGNSAGTTGAPLAERWTAGRWLALRARHPAGSSVGFLSGVSCTSSRSCTAVGFYVDPSGEGRPLAERWNGTVWRIQRTPHPRAAVYLQLVGISCTRQGPCMAAGFFSIVTGIEVMVAERWSGTNWSLQKTLYPDGATGVQFAGVGCASPRSCTAVGFFGDAAGTDQPLAEKWDGTSWAIEQTPSPVGATSASLSGIACTGVPTCTAVGSYVNHLGITVTLAERYS
jgi:hypothetical protein